MTVLVNIDLAYEFAVKADYDTVFATLSDVPKSASFFPKLDRLVDLGDGVYRWEMAKVSVGQINLQTIYASRYVADKAKGSMVWTTVPGEGNALVSGSWQMTDTQPSTHLVLKLQGELSLALPGLMKAMIAPVVEAEFKKLLERYIGRLTEHFGGQA